MFSSGKKIVGNHQSILKAISQSYGHRRVSVACFNSASDQNKATREREKQHPAARRKSGEDDVVDLARDMGGAAAEIAKTGMVGAMETDLMVGEMAKQTMDGVWDLTKKTVETVRDSIADPPPPHHHHRRQQQHHDDVMSTSAYESNKSQNGKKKKNVDDKVFVDHSGNKKNLDPKDDYGSNKEDKHVDLI